MNKFIFFIILMLISFTIFPEERFPSPEFTTDYIIPDTMPESTISDLQIEVDLYILFIFLLLAVFFIINKRNRNYIYFLTVSALLYFGFIRSGCVCSIGAIQNVISSLLFKNYFISISVITFFFLPIFFSLLYGRVFCGAVCPLGSIQELLFFKPLRINTVLQSLLSLIPFLYLSLTLIFVVAEQEFIICSFDPFIEIFRMSFDKSISLLTISFLILSIFIARPYCRFLCPYSPILGLASYFSKYHVVITKEECIDCRLCENSCPVDAIEIPSKEDQKLNKLNKILLYLIISPLIIFMTVKIFLSLPVYLSFNDVKYLKATLLASGLFTGLVIIIKLLSKNRRSAESGYKIDKFNCISCGRCIEYCPKNEG